MPVPIAFYHAKPRRTLTVVTINVREPKNVLAKSVALCPGNVITRDLVGDICGNQSPGVETEEHPLSQWSLEEVEKTHVLRVLEATSWHRAMPAPY